MTPTKQEIDSLVSQVMELTSCHAIWWEIVNSDNRSQFERVFDRYPWYFGPVIRAMQEDIMIIISRLFDRSPISCSFRTLIKKLAKSEPKQACALQRKLLTQRFPLRNCREFRNKVHAHRDRKWLGSDIYQEIKVTLRDLDRICEFVPNWWRASVKSRERVHQLKSVRT